MTELRAKYAQARCAITVPNNFSRTYSSIIRRTVGGSSCERKMRLMTEVDSGALVIAP